MLAGALGRLATGWLLAGWLGNWTASALLPAPSQARPRKSPGLM